MFRVIAHYPPSDHPDRDPQHHYGGSISYDYATRAEAQERYDREAGHTHSIELWYVEPGRNQRLNPFAWPQGLQENGTMTQRTVALYLRVSTGEQTVDNQRRELLAAAQRRGWIVASEFCDEGISGANGRDKRPGFDKLCRAVVRHQIDVVAVWSVDRLGRSLQDLVAFLGELQGSGVDLYLDRQGIDTSTPAEKALFQMLGVFAEFERSLIVERVRAGIARARTAGTKSGKAFGRPKNSRARGGCTGFSGGWKWHQEDRSLERDW